MNTQTSVSDITFVAFDFETTGLYPVSDRIVEFGAVKFKSGKIIETFESLVKPDVPISADAERVSGISNAMVSTAPLLSEVLPKFLDFIKGTVLLAHNADFDSGFLKASIQRLNLPNLDALIIDTLGLSKRAFTGLKSYSLQSLVSHLQIPPNQAHRALDDSIMCMKLFEAACDTLSFMGDISLKEVIA